uniref:Formate/nitrite transporter n=1 Tax=Aureoumbra lagunensis TaxID=44058 RepID=A0A7S3NKV6_9STRA|mmetsp:Transcript_3255/g.4514  ORF Transcript_3255/g.4514 Transcript_3255/m.4514 type:complete len:347 (+) Transcript_3255:67-1107(+)
MFVRNMRYSLFKSCLPNIRHPLLRLGLMSTSSQIGRPALSNELKKEECDEVKNLSEPQKAMLYLNEIGLTRGERNSGQIFTSALLGGAYLSWGGAMFVLLGGGTAEAMDTMPGLHKALSALIFPIGLTSIVVTGADLLTSNMSYASLPIISGDERRTLNKKISSLIHLWTISAAGNFAASCGMALMTSHLFIDTSMATFAAALATKKVAGSTVYIFTKAIGANWLVNLAIFEAATAKSSPGKAAMLWLPITTFVALGLEHSVANFYFLPLGYLCGADITYADMLHNLAPAITGNIVGASFFFSYLQWKALDPPLKSNTRVLSTSATPTNTTNTPLLPPTKKEKQVE